MNIINFIKRFKNGESGKLEAELGGNLANVAKNDVPLTNYLGLRKPQGSFDKCEFDNIDVAAMHVKGLSISNTKLSGGSILGSTFTGVTFSNGSIVNA